MTKKFKPENDEALKKLVRETVKAADADDPSVPPHRVRDRVRRQAKGEIGVEEYVRRQQAERKNKRP